MSLGIKPVTSLGVAFWMEKFLVRHFQGSKVYIKAFRIISLKNIKRKGKLDVMFTRRGACEKEMMTRVIAWSRMVILWILI